MTSVNNLLRMLRKLTVMKKMTKKNYPPLLLLWLGTGMASTLIGAFTHDLLLLGGGAGVMLLEALYVSNMPKPEKGRLIA